MPQNLQCLELRAAGASAPQGTQAYAYCLLNSFLVRKAASQVSIHRNTSSRWLHRFLALARTDQPRCLHGIAEADKMYVLESQKGSKLMAQHLQRACSGHVPTFAGDI